MAGQVTWTYDTDFRVATESVNGAHTISFDYDPDSLLIQAGALGITRDAQHGLITGTSLGSLTGTRCYTIFGELSGYQAALGASELLATQYIRDKLGRIIQKTETLGGVTETFSYSYL